MKLILSLFIFLFTVNTWCQYEELNNAQWLSINNSKMIELVKMNQSYLNNREEVKVKAVFLKNTKDLDSLRKLSIKVIDSIKTQVLKYPTMLNSLSEKRRVLQHHKKIRNYSYKFKKITLAMVSQLNKKEEELEMNILLRLQRKQVRCLIQIKKHTTNLEKIYMYTLKDSRAY
jgi:hypothetical protein